MKTNIYPAVAFFVLSASFLANDASSNGAKSATPAGISAPQDVLQRASLLPDEQDLQSFTRISPVGEFGEDQLFQNGQWVHLPKPPTVTQDETEINVDLSQKYAVVWKELSRPWHGYYSKQKRVLFSNNGLYKIDMTVWLCDTSQAAQAVLEEYHANSNAFYHAGTLTSTSQIGDASWACTGYPPSKSLLCLAGNVVVLLNAGPSRSASIQGLEIDFPNSAIEAVAYQVLLRASQQSELTGVSVQQASVSVNGHALPKTALLVAGQMYVPVAEFAKAMGLTSEWNTKTGALTLSGAGRKTITLTADSTASTVGGTKATALSVPVLKQNGQPVMTLTDLLAVTGGRITSHNGNTVQVKG